MSDHHHIPDTGIPFLGAKAPALVRLDLEDLEEVRGPDRDLDLFGRIDEDLRWPADRMFFPDPRRPEEMDEALDTYGPAVNWNAQHRLAEGLSQGEHVLRIEVTGRKHEKSSNTYVQVVGFDVR